MEAHEIIVAIVTSLIASIMFWVVFNVIPDRRERKKMKPLIDFDLYKIYMKLGHFVEMPFIHSKHSPALNQRQVFNGEVTKVDFGLFLSTKCETEEHKKIDDLAKNLIPIGHELAEISQEILGMIQKIYVFNKYLTAEQIKLCRKIADKITTYGYEDDAHLMVDGRLMVPLDPTMKSMKNMFFELYQLYLQLRTYLINQDTVDNEFGDFYQQLARRKVELLYSQKKYKKVLKLIDRMGDNSQQPYYFRSLYHLGRKVEGLALLRDYLQKEGMFLIYLRGYFEEFENDESIKEALINARSDEQYNKMVECINEEKEFWEQFKKAAGEIKEYYENKVTNHIKVNALKEGIVVNDVKME